MDSKDYLRSLWSSIQAKEPPDWDEIEKSLSDVQDPALLARLRSMVEPVTTLDLTRKAPVTPPTAESAPSQLSPGDRIAGRYGVEEFIDRGAMGEVYRATDELLGVAVAVKLLRPEIGSQPAALRAFKQEVLLARSISHPNVCRIYDLGRDEARGVTYLTMEFLPGETLQRRISRTGPFGTNAALPLVRQLAEGLDAAHRAGVIHRDFKAGNVMLVPEPGGDRAVITDFGLAIEQPRPDVSSGGTTQRTPRQTSEETTARLPSKWRIVGTPGYMSPEQVVDGKLTSASDLYALGGILFKMVTGRLPFVYANPFVTALAQVNEEPPSPAKFAKVDAGWEDVILKLLSKQPADRHATAAEVVRVLENRSADPEAKPNSLPAERDAFVGRSSELTQVANLLEENSDGVRLLTLHGPAGTGKTRLAQRYGWNALTRWPGGVWFCDLRDAKSAEGIGVAVATSMGVPLTGVDPIAQLGHAMDSQGQTLIILDNFEQVVGHAEGTLARWLRRSPGPSFLVTSQERLQLPDETVLELGPLDPATSGVELFELRARRHRAGFLVDESNRADVEDIVRRLDGLPLAIELAAARLRLLAVEQLRERLRDRFKVLTGGVPGRHATLRMALDWSWELLEPREQSAIAQASIFEGGFTVESAESVIEIEPPESVPNVLDILQSLIDKSWLRTEVTADVLRLEMSATVKEYSSTRLDAFGGSGDRDTLRHGAERRHGRFYSQLGTDDALTVRRRDGGIGHDRLLPELDNLVVACRRSIESKDEVIAASSFAGVTAILGSNGPFGMAVQLGVDALNVATIPRLRAQILYSLSNLEMCIGRLESARDRAEASLAIYRETNDREKEASALANVALIYLNLHLPEAACRHYEEAMALHRDLRNREGERSVLAGLGRVQAMLGDLGGARRSLEAALALSDEEDRPHRAFVLNTLAFVHMKQNNPEESLKLDEEALAIHREFGHTHAEGVVLSDLGRLHYGEGRWDEAYEHYQAALTVYRKVGNQRNEGVALSKLGTVRRHQGHSDVARALYERSLAIVSELRDLRMKAHVLDLLGELHDEQGRVEEARSCLRDAVVALRELGDPATLARLLCSVAEFESKHHDLASGRAALDEAESIEADLQDAELSERVSRTLQSVEPRRPI